MACLVEKTGLIRDKTSGYKEIAYAVPNLKYEPFLLFN